MTDWVKRSEVRREAQLKRFRVKQAAVAYKGGKCELCSYNRSLRAFDFHHRNPVEKDFSISKKMHLPWDDIRAELDKCVLVCANCHREIHDGLYPHLFEAMDDAFTED